MTDVFADTYYFIAILSRTGEDARRRAVEATVNRRGRLVTTAWMMTEVANFLCDSRHRTAFLDTLAALNGDPESLIVPPDEQLFRDGINRFADRPDKDWSLTDCISFLVMERYGIAEALTEDHHFEQAGFKALLK